MWCRDPRLSADTFTKGHLMKMKLLVTDVTGIGTPGRAERAVLGVILAGDVFGQFRTCLWSLSHVVIYEPPLELYIARILLRYDGAFLAILTPQFQTSITCQ